MRLEKRLNGERGDLSLGIGSSTMTYVMKPEELARLAIWIEELFPEAVAEERKPKAESYIRDDHNGVP